MNSNRKNNKKIKQQQDPVNPEIAEGTCPFCGSDDITWGSLEVDDFNGNIFYRCWCNKCEEHFNVIYETKYVGTEKC